MTVTSAPIGSTGQSLDGFAVNANVPDAFRESVVLTDPTDPLGAAAITSTQPIDVYGLPVWLLGTPSVGIAGALPALAGVSSTFTVNLEAVSSTFVVNPVAVSSTFVVNAPNPVSTFAVNSPATVSSQIVSSIPIIVAQSSAPWSVIGSVGVSSASAIVSTVVVSTAPQAIVGTSQVFGTVSTQVVSSIPFFVSQSSAPWTMNGAVSVSSGTLAVTNTVNVIGSVSVSSQAAVSSSWPLSTTMVNVVSTVTQMVINLATSTSTNLQSTSKVALATLNTTVIKASPGTVYGYHISNFASTSVYVKIANASSAVIASTAAYLMVLGVSPSTSIYSGMDVGATFSTGITMFTMRNGWPQDLTAPLGSTCVVNLFYA